MAVFEIVQCSQGEECLNSLAQLGQGSAKCGSCRFAPNNVGGMNFWKPTIKGKKHLSALAEKLEKKIARTIELKAKKAGVSKAKQVVLKAAARAEKATERHLIRATKNSGRSNRDGDHVAAGQITMDTKLQTKRIDPVVHLHELFKVREDAKNGGNQIGALVLRNSNNVGVVAIHEDDFARLLKQIV